MSVFSDFKYYGVSNIRILYNLFFDRGSSAIFLYRLSRLCMKYRLKPIAIIIRQLNIIINTCEISYNTQIGVGFKIYHSIGIVIGDAQIGNRFTIFQNVTIGRNEKPNKAGNFDPIIGDDVTFYAGCVVVGGIEIGNNSTVGANAVVTKDIPSNSTVLGSKAQFFSKEEL